MKNLVQSFKNLIFSQKCPICKKEVDSNYYLCDSCYTRLKKKEKLRNCSIFYYSYYYDTEIRRLITDFKLNNRKRLGIEIASLIQNSLNALIKEKKIDVIIPVPISRERMKERGFNQVELLLDYCQIEYSKIYRKKNTEHMYKFLNREDREKNIRNVFRNREVKIEDKNILLVDDIVTTGATIKEIIRELTKSSSPKKIYIYSIAISKMFKTE